MAEIEAAIKALVSGSNNLTNLIMDRCWAQFLPEAADLPAIIYQRVSTNRMRTLSGPNGIAEPRIRFSIIGAEAQGFAQVREISRLLRALLDGYSGTVAAVQILDCWIEDENEETLGDVGSYFYQVSLDFTFMHKEN